MTSWKRPGAVLLIVGVLSAQQAVQDPVVKIRSQRAASGEGDLPPVPRAILEPPALPPPETHVKDTAGWRASRAARKVRGKAASRTASRTSKKVVKGRATASPAKKVPRKKKH